MVELSRTWWKSNRIDGDAGVSSTQPEVTTNFSRPTRPMFFDTQWDGISSSSPHPARETIEEEPGPLFRHERRRSSFSGAVISHESRDSSISDAVGPHERRHSSISKEPIAVQQFDTPARPRAAMQRRRSNSLPMPTATQARSNAEVRTVVFTPSPFRRDTKFQIPFQPLATFKGERLLEGVSEDDERRPSVASLENWHHKTKLKKPVTVRSKRAQLAFEYSVYLFLLCFVYFVLVGMPLWKGFVFYTWYGYLLTCGRSN